MFETLQPGQSWDQLNFLKCITTSEPQKDYINSVMRRVSFDVISPVLSDCFVKPELPPKTIISIHTRDQRDTANLIKKFYIKFPQYRWITFRDMRGLSEEEFAKTMKDSFMSVWIDPTSGFGTYPLECMKMGIPVVGILPQLQPEWLNENNGIWIANKNTLADVVADFVQNWLEDNISPDLYVEMEKTSNQYSNMEKFKADVISTFSDMINKRMSSFEEQLNKLETTE